MLSINRFQIIVIVVERCFKFVYRHYNIVLFKVSKFLSVDTVYLLQCKASCFIIWIHDVQIVTHFGELAISSFILFLFVVVPASKWTCICSGFSISPCKIFRISIHARVIAFYLCIVCIDLSNRHSSHAYFWCRQAVLFTKLVVFF